ncbi:hypothetical protein QR680_007607 [Steinernema hermaphroditum]|uniref:Uncharacterized protein n=1 Tax=Steinernema hermaphroditum TaxID=289476 RepID=A0AA39IDP4_9BILA|nr:hypothetical protein QR680_007607 [Steinernema hermaphroditum]
MDALPFDFVAAVMRIHVTAIDYMGHTIPLYSAELLGAGYGRSAQEIKEKACDCSVVVHGLFCSVPIPPGFVISPAVSFNRHNKGGEVFEVPCATKDVALFSVRAKRLTFRRGDALDEGVTLLKLRKLQHRCRRVRVRELIVERFPWKAVRPSAFANFSDETTFFNRAVLHFHEGPWFQEFLQRLVEAGRLESLHLFDRRASNYFNFHHDYFQNPPFDHTVHPEISLQKALTDAFGQSQLLRVQLSLSFSHWISKIFFRDLVNKWLTDPKTFPETTKYLDFLHSPDVDLLRKLGFRLTNLCGRTGQIQGRFVCRSYMLPHPKEIERTLRITCDLTITSSSSYFLFVLSEIGSTASLRGKVLAEQRCDVDLYWSSKRSMFCVEITRMHRMTIL